MVMLHDALVGATVLLASTTMLLVLAGTRPTPFAARVLLLVGVAAAAALGASPATVATVTVIALGSLAMPRHWFAVGAWAFSSFLMASGLYAVYLARAVLLLGDGPGPALLGLVLFALELGAMALLLGSAFELVDALCGPPVAPIRPMDPAAWPAVCLQVPTYNEPADLVIGTIRSLAAIDYPRLRIQVIDNNTEDPGLWRPVEAECARLRAAGVEVAFVHLPEWPGYKGGALNWGLANLDDDVEVVGVVDADYVVDPGWLRATVPHFADPSVAFVQTPQDYREWESSSFYRACFVGFAYFFRVSMVSRARRNSIIFAGTMGLVRRAVLDEVGGWDERIITEDAEISIRVRWRGYRTVYEPAAYGRGIMPLTYEGLRKQRFRWAFGGIQILKRHWRALLLPRSGLTPAQRYAHLAGGLWWFNDALTLGFTVFVLVAAVGLAIGRPFVVQRLTGLGLVLPLAFIVLNLIRYLWAMRVTTGARPPLALSAMRVNLSLSWVIALACARGLVQERGVFLRTPKFAGAAAIRELRLVWVEGVIGGAAAILAAVVLGVAGFSVAGQILGILLLWAVLIYGSAIGFALGDPTRAPLADVLRDKARLEVAPRVGRVAASRSARAGLIATLLGAFLLVAILAAESDSVVLSDLPFDAPARGPIAGPIGSLPSASPGSRPNASPGASLEPSGLPAVDGVPGTTTGPGGTGPTSRPGPTPTAAPTQAPTPAPRPTPPIPVPTPAPTSVPTPRASPPRTAPPNPGSSVPPHPSAPVP